MLATPAASEQNIFNELSSNEISSLSSFYQNNSNFSLYQLYVQSKEYNPEYPFYSYNLALKCQRAILKNSTDKMVAINGTNTVISYMFDKIKNDNNELQEELINFKTNDLSFSGMEWASLAERDFNESKYYLSVSQEYYNNSDFNNTLDSLSKSNFAIYKTRNLLKVAKSKNNYSPKINNIQIIMEEKKVASEWIQTAIVQTSQLNNSNKRSDILELAQSSLNDSEEYYSDENYYLAIMSAAETKALIEFGLEEGTSANDTLSKAEKQLMATNESLNEIINDSNIDFPLVELNFETAKMRLNEAKNKDAIDAIPLEDASIRYSLIAKEQAKGVLALKKAIDDSEKSTEKSRLELTFFNFSGFFNSFIT
jgi:hypothetical protein